MKRFYLKLGFFQFPFLTSVAMLLHSDYSFSHNFFSDLGRISTVFTSGNLISWILFALSLIILGASIVLFYIGNILGVISGFSFICVALTPIDIFPFLHMLFAILAFFLLTLATVKANLRILTGLFFAFFFNFFIADTVIMQVLNQKFAIYSMVVLHLICLYNLPYLMNQYYQRIWEISSFYFENSSYFWEKGIIKYARIYLEYQ